MGTLMRSLVCDRRPADCTTRSNQESTKVTGSQTAINIQRVAQSLSTLLSNCGVGMVGIMLVELETASASLSLVALRRPEATEEVGHLHVPEQA